MTIQPSTHADQLLRFEIDLEPGQNTIRAIAFNADNSMQSTDAVLDVQANIAPRQPALHAVVVGIKDFANPRLALKYSVADAELFASALEEGGAGLYSAVHVRRLLTPEETTSSAIIAALKRAQTGCWPGRSLRVLRCKPWPRRRRTVSSHHLERRLDLVRSPQAGRTWPEHTEGIDFEHTVIEKAGRPRHL